MSNTARVSGAISDGAARRVSEMPVVDNTARVALSLHSFLLLEGDAQVTGEDVLLLEDGGHLLLEGDAVSVRGTRVKRVPAA